MEKLNKLLPNEETYTCFSTDREMNVPGANPSSKELPYTQIGQLPPTLRIKTGAPVVITTNHSKAMYKEDGIMNGARGCIDYIQTNEEDPHQVEIIWVVFNNRQNGAKYRADHRHRQGIYYLMNMQHPFFPSRKDFKLNQEMWNTNDANLLSHWPTV